jgi:hypothetical protein
MKQPITHFTWSIERGDKCPRCGSLTLLVLAPLVWRTDPEANAEYMKKKRTKEEPTEEPEIIEDISGHWCPKCWALASLSFNS